MRKVPTTASPLSLRHILQGGASSLTSGSQLEDFEEMFAAWVGLRHCLAVNKGTTALYLAIRAMRRLTGKTEVLLPALHSSKSKAYYARNIAIRKSIEEDEKCVLFYAFDEEPVDGNVPNKAWYFDADNDGKTFDREKLYAKPDGVLLHADYGRFIGRSGAAFEWGGKFDVGEDHYSPALDITNEITIEAWIMATVPKEGGGGSGYDVLTKWDDDMLRSYRLLLVNYDEGLGLWLMLYDPDGVGSHILTGEEKDCPVNQWHHIAATFDGTTVRLYMNGVERRNSLAFSGKTIRDTGAAAHVQIGEDMGFPGVQARLSEVSLYARALSEAEIRAHYEGGKG